MVAHGRSTRGEANARSRMTRDGVRDARDAVRAGETRQSIAERLGVSYFTVCDAISGRTWGHVPGALEAGSLRRDRCGRLIE